MGSDTISKTHKESLKKMFNILNRMKGFYVLIMSQLVEIMGKIG